MAARSSAAQLAHGIVEAGDGHAAVWRVQAGDQRRQRVQRVGDRAAVAAGVQILGRAVQGELQPGQAAAGDRERRLV